MQALIQRVHKASVRISKEKRDIGPGLVILLGVGKNDTEEDAKWLAEKTAKLRVFSNQSGKFDFSVADVKGQALVISQFTLYGDCRKGTRPDFGYAAGPDKAKPLYEKYVSELKKFGISVVTGEFGAHMDVELVNNGPVTILIEKEQE
ncbi:MAG: D-aminoacyl-tRNA deacylase [Elusimicrobia bacterium]|nr:D-aminoacyl-tRNA deacylase [Elusimicrobiota bacterium]